MSIEEIEKRLSSSDAQFLRKNYEDLLSKGYSKEDSIIISVRNFGESLKVNVNNLKKALNVDSLQKENSVSSEPLLVQDFYYEVDSCLEKASKKDLSKLRKIQKVVFVNGKPKKMTYYVKDGETEKVVEGKEGWEENLFKYDKIEEFSFDQKYKIKTKQGKKIEGKPNYIYIYDKPDQKYFSGIQFFDEYTQKDKFVNFNNISEAVPVKESTVEEFEKTADEGKEKDKYGYTFLKGLGGSTGAQLVEKDGVKYIKKTAASADHLRNEVRSIKYFKEMGVPVPEVKEYIKGEAVYLEFIEGETLGKTGYNQETIDKVTDTFVAQAIMANHDCIGLNMDNVIIKPDGSPVFVDVGGSMGYRAQGGIKHSWEDWNNNKPVAEINSMLDSNMNWQTHNMFKENGKITPEMMLEQVKKIEDLKPLWLTDTTEYSQKLKQRFESVKKLLTEEEKPKYSEELYEQIKNSYWDEGSTALKYGRKDIADFYDDLSKYAAEPFTKDEKEWLEDNMQYSKTREEYIEKNKSYDKEKVNFLKRNKSLEPYEVLILDEYTGGSYSDYSQTFRDCFNVTKDNWNVSFSDKKEIKFDKQNIENAPRYSRARLKVVLRAFAKLKADQSEKVFDSDLNKYVPKNQDWVKEKTLYRGFDVNDDSAFFDSNDIISVPNMASYSSNREKYFKSKNSQMVLTGASGVDIVSFSNFGESEAEILVPPFTLHQTTFAKKGIDKNYFRAETPGLMPWEKDEEKNI